MATIHEHLIPTIPATALLAMTPNDLSELHALLSPRVERLHAQGRYAEAERVDAVCLDLETELRQREDLRFRAPRTSAALSMYFGQREAIAMSVVLMALGSEG